MSWLADAVWYNFTLDVKTKNVARFVYHISNKSGGESVRTVLIYSNVHYGKEMFGFQVAIITGSFSPKF